MKIDLDAVGEVVVPSVIEKVFRKAKEEGLRNKDKQEREWWEQFDNSPAGDEKCFRDWWEEGALESFQPPDEGLMDNKEVAQFLIAWELGNVAIGGGYPKESCLMFEDNGYRYTICAYGWSSDLEEKHHGISMIGYKEKLSTKGGKKNESKNQRLTT